jgi:hypothetical protein
MHIKRFLGGAFILVACTVAVYWQHEEWRRMLDATVAEQTAWIKSDLERGMPPVDPDGGIISRLILNRSDVTLPLIEEKIEEVLRSPTPSDSFTDKSVNPAKFVDFAALAISEAGNARSLKEVGKLLKIDEKRFGYLVDHTLVKAGGYRNPFTVAYEGFAIGDPAIDSRIATWAERELLLLPPTPPKDYSRVPGGELLRQNDIDTRISMISEARTRWAEAMLDKYAGVPSEAQWRSDPLVSRLKPAQASSVYDEVIRHACEIVQKRGAR